MTNVFGLDKNYLDLIEERFAEKRKLAFMRENELFSIFKENLTQEEEVALKYLYSFMSLVDLSDYDGKLFLSHVRNILKARNMTSWGKNIPGEVFLHFVIPIRVNNENLELYCEPIFDEVFNRVKDMSMDEAILEINHWCHEKATYVGSDMRTIAPLTLMKNGLGRCGEESTFTVSALRSLSIPSRQCYTPRWAHCNDNHAWVEAWADGKWYFLGACEPETRLNMGWFTGPARRAMLVHTKVPGRYGNDENITSYGRDYTELNLLQGYTKSKKITIKVVDENGLSIEGAKVHFEVYNSGEFFPLAKLSTDKEGEASLLTGLGDLLIHAYKDDKWSFERVSVKDTDILQMVIKEQNYEAKIIDFDMVPPPAINASENNVSQEEVEKNNARLKYEDELRVKHEKTFVSQEESYRLAESLNFDKERVWSILKEARGNSQEISKFINKFGEKYGDIVLDLLESIRKKDLRDTYIETLEDHLVNSLDYEKKYEKDVFVNYVMCPRIYYEMLVPYRKFLKNSFNEEEKLSFIANPAFLVKWVKDNIEILEGYTSFFGFATPKGSFEIKKTDKASRDILFVAIARSIGIPARIELTDRRPQFLKEGKWVDAGFTKIIDVKELPYGKLKLILSKESDVKPEYYNNFTIARFENGVFTTLDYEGTGIGYFENYFDIQEGYYKLVTGTRLENGTVLSKVVFFEIKEGNNYDITLEFRKDSDDVETLGIVNGLNGLTAIKEDENKAINLDKNTVIAWIEPDREPSKHLIRELKELKDEFGTIDAPIYICLGQDKFTSAFDINSYQGLPENCSFALDKIYECLKEFEKAVEKNIGGNYPAVFVVDNNKKIKYLSTGYKVGIAEDIIKILKKIK